MAAGVKGAEGPLGVRGPGGRPGCKGDQGERGQSGQKGTWMIEKLNLLHFTQITNISGSESDNRISGSTRFTWCEGCHGSSRFRWKPTREGRLPFHQTQSEFVHPIMPCRLQRSVQWILSAVYQWKQPRSRTGPG